MAHGQCLEELMQRWSDMVGFTGDGARYAGRGLDAWIAEVGRLLRSRR
jgi:hypothetical protein